MNGGRPGCRAVRHGTALAYQVDRCRCPDSRESYRLYRKRLREGRHRPLRVDSTGTARRLQALATIGWPAHVLARRLGCSGVTVANRRRGRGPRVNHVTAARVTALYEWLSGTAGPSAVTRSRAAAAGWAAPLLWEGRGIDDPAARPHHDPPTRLGTGSSRVRLDEVAHLTACGLSTAEVAARLGVQVESLQRAQTRAAAREAA